MTLKQVSEMEISKLVTQWTLMYTWEIDASQDQFWMAIDVYTKRSHIINRRLIGGEILTQFLIENDVQLVNLLSSLKNVSDVQEIMQTVEPLTKTNQRKGHRVVTVKKVMPKNSSLQPNIEVIVNDYNNNFVSFYNTKNNIAASNTAPGFPYAFSYKSSKFKLWIEEGVKPSDASYQWILTKLVPKLIKWVRNVDDKKSTDAGSLRLVQVTEYSTLYNKLKETYGKQLVQMWPENTDPLKFVYEDIGIAAYLLLLWAGKPKQRFVDLGCGNGLLVHILNSEGHLGVGYDLRARKIWNMYPPSTKLQVRTIIPSSETVFPDANWLIGNHSDELTVWIPVMAARSSFSCNFFLLPCCPYDFDGRKYCRVDSSVSQYSDFLSYVETVCKECRIVTEKDKLRIPSTKRTCFVGTRRSYPESELKDNLGRLQAFVDIRCGLQSSGGEQQTVWCAQFKPRVEDKVRNCTQIHVDIRETIVNLVVQELLVKRRLSFGGWNYGGVVELSTLAKIIPTETLKKLKSECGGLQTLLKNYHYIFKVQSGKVEFRVPTERLKTDSSCWKKKTCWFYHNHPKSCPLADDKCSFIHDS